MSSIAQAVRLSELEKKVEQIQKLMQSYALQNQIEELKDRIATLETRRIGRPPKQEQNGRETVT